MNLVEKINQDFVSAFKAKDTIKKSALSGLKSKLSEAAKIKKEDLSDTEVLKIIVSNIKQRNQSIAEFTKANRLDLVEQEQNELSALEVYLPAQLSKTEVLEKVKQLAIDFESESNQAKKLGQIKGAFNKLYTGQFDQKDLTEAINEL
jgi:uncharacterized protein YqeY